MNNDLYPVFYPFTAEFPSTRVRETLQRGLDSDWTTTKAGDSPDEGAFTSTALDQFGEEADTSTAIQMLSEGERGVLTIFPGNPGHSFTFGVGEWSNFGLPDLSGVYLAWHRSQFYDDPEPVVETVFETATTVFESLEPTVAFSYLPQEQGRSSPVTRNDVEQRRLPDVYWLMLLSESLVDSVGRDRLETCPAWKVEALGDGGIGVVATPDPFGNYTREVTERIRRSLGLHQQD